MCGRYAFFSPAEAVKRTFRLEAAPALEPRYNISPTQSVPAVRADEAGERALAMLHWGLVPSWAKERAIGNRMINARAETVADKPSFRAAYRRRRCLVLADGWYEWQQAADGKQPWFIRLKSEQPIGFAGLWESWKDPAEGGTLESCTIITTDAAASVADIHHRMPVILAEPAWTHWLDPKYFEVDELGGLLGPCDPDWLKAWPVSRRVNAPKNQGPALIEEVGPGASDA